jgi:transmembrane sensor
MQRTRARGCLVDSANPLPLEADPAAREAAEWLLELQSPDLSVDRIIAWQEWLFASDRNRRMFERIGSAWTMLDRSCRPLPWPDEAEVEEDRYDGSVSVSEWRRTQSAGHPAGRVSEPHPTTRGPIRVNTRNRGFLAAAAAIILAVGMGVVARRIAVSNNEPFVLETNAAENREVALADGSSVTLGGKSRLSITLGKHTRDVRLERGEAFFHVAHDPRRPFIVRTDATSVTAVGTEFDVRLASERLVVAVAEGTVRVQAATSTGPAIAEADSTHWHSGSSASVSAGEELTLTESGAAVIRLIDSRTVAEWREGRLQYVGEPLNAVVSDVSRYVTYKIVVADPTLAALRMTGTISTRDVQSWLQSVEVALPVHVAQIAGGGVRLEARGTCCRYTYPPTVPR